MKSGNSDAGLLDSGGYLNTQTSDTQYFGLMGSQATGMRPLEPLEDREDNDYVDETGSRFGSIFGVSQVDDIPPVILTPEDRLLESYADSAPSDKHFPILEKFGDLCDIAQATEPVMRQKLGDPLTEEEKKVSEDFVVACQRLAMSGNRDPLCQPNTLEIELAAVLTHIAQSVPLITRLSMEVHCIGRIVEDEVNPEITSEEVIAWNYTQEWVTANN
ncbi:hypothetical protein DFH08DRAFT_821153 [Mycena albidolilacea]|uniref:Uncharacterized protein n=1 Tax=Mycena albidolilacea TaxID=1033008 RepID=A0AAD6ZBW5_9AGAR|nr:hypothetical protein DFH08DRAFT_821153 [Mycena albidolilacea]